MRGRLFFLALFVLMGSVFAFTVVNNCTTLDIPGEVYEVNGSLANLTSQDTLTCINITADDIIFNLNGSKINGSSSVARAAIRINASGVTVENGTVSDSYWGVVFLSAENGSVKNITSRDNTYGFVLRSFSNYTNITNSTAYTGSLGFLIDDYGHNNIFTNNTAYNFTGDGFVVFSLSNNNTFSNNTAYNNTNGFRVEDACKYNLLKNNTAYNNTQYGFYVYLDSEHNTLEYNTAYLNYRGFYVYNDANNNTFTGNTVYNSTKEGFFIELSHNNTFIDNTARNGTWNGFRFLRSPDSYLRGNFAHNNTRTAFDFAYSNRTIIEDNRGQDFNVEFSVWCRLINNTAYDTQVGRGFTIQEGSHYSVLENNTASGAIYDGFWVDSSSYNCNLTNNTAYNNTESGFDVFEALNTTLRSNTAYRNTNLGGFYISDSAGSLLFNNTAYDNTRGLTLYRQCDDLEITWNQFYNNTQSDIFISTDGGGTPDSNVFTNNIILDSKGLSLNSTLGSDNNFTNLTIKNTKIDLNFIGNITVNVSPSSPAPAPPGLLSLGRRLNITNSTGSALVNLTIHYEEADLFGKDENTIVMYKYSGSSWIRVSTLPGVSCSLDTSTNTYTCNNIPSFSNFELFADQVLQTLYVNGTDAGDCVQGINYSTIQEAVNTANPGDTIIVCRNGTGNYSESVTVDKPLNIFGNESNVTVAGIAATVFSVSAGHVNISKFLLLVPAGFYGVSVNGYNYLNITDVAVSGGTRSFSALFSENSTFSENIARDSSQYGFYLELCNKTNVISNSIINNSAWGIELHGGLNNNLTGNTVRESGSHGFRIIAENTTLIGNTANNNSGSGFTIDGWNNTLRDNIAYNNTECGFEINEKDNILINNTAYYNILDGFLVLFRDNILTNNTAYGQTKTNYAGFHLYSDDSTFEGTISYSNYIGLWLDGESDRNSFTSTTLEGNSYFDIYISGVPGSESDSNQFIDTSITSIVGIPLNSTGGLNNTFTTFGIENTIFDLEFKGDLILNKSSSSGQPSGYLALSRETNITNTSALALNLTIHYLDSDLSGKDENTIKMFKYNGTWKDVSALPGVTCSLDAGANTYTCRNISSFSVFGLFAQATTPPSSGGGTTTPSSDGLDYNTYIDCKNKLVEFTVTDTSGSPVTGQIYLYLMIGGTLHPVGHSNLETLKDVDLHFTENGEYLYRIHFEDYTDMTGKTITVNCAPAEEDFCASPPEGETVENAHWDIDECFWVCDEGYKMAVYGPPPFANNVLGLPAIVQASYLEEYFSNLGNYYQYVECVPEAEEGDYAWDCPPPPSPAEVPGLVWNWGSCNWKCEEPFISKPAIKSYDEIACICPEGYTFTGETCILEELECDEGFTPTIDGCVPVNEVPEENDKNKDGPCYGDYDCPSDQYCSNGLCKEVVPENDCGYADGHRWVEYECCENDNCPEGSLCQNNECVSADAEILGPEEVTVGEEEEIIITLQNSPYSNGNVHITGPSGKPYMAYTDENGKLTVPFDMVGNYTIELLVDGHLLKAKSIESLSVIVEPEEKSWLIQWWESDVGRGISLLFLLLAVFIAYYFLSGKTKKKKNGNGKKYRKP